MKKGIKLPEDALKPLFGYTISANCILVKQSTTLSGAGVARVNFKPKPKRGLHLARLGAGARASWTVEWWAGPGVWPDPTVPRGAAWAACPPSKHASSSNLSDFLSLASERCRSIWGQRATRAPRLLSSVIARNNLVLCGFLCGVLRAGNCQGQRVSETPYLPARARGTRAHSSFFANALRKPDDCCYRLTTLANG